MKLSLQVGNASDSLYDSTVSSTEVPSAIDGVIHVSSCEGEASRGKHLI